jgi:adenosylcobinamide-phosphate synthase
VRVTAKQLVAGVAIDLACGDPQWLPHPVRALGSFAAAAERFWRKTNLPLRLAGALFWTTVVGTTVVLVRLTLPWAAVYWIYSLLACRDLDVEAARVVRALRKGDIEEARKKLAWIVGRDTAQLDEKEILRATVETVAENLSDGVIAPLFYLGIAGPVGMAVYKAINTLDSTVGYRNEKYSEFGWTSARMDDLANFAPARITALLVSISALLPGFRAKQAARMAWRDGWTQPSPNAGYPEAAMAGALGVQLGGVNYYRGVPSRKPFLGDPVVPLTPAVFQRARVLLYASEFLFVAILLRFCRWR